MTNDMETRMITIEREQAELRLIARELRDLGARQADAIEKLVRLEERHSEQRDAISRAFTLLEHHGRDLSEMKIALPPLQETRRWMMTGVISLVGVVLLALVGLVIKP